MSTMRVKVDEDLALIYRGKIIGRVSGIELELDSDAIFSERSERTDTQTLAVSSRRTKGQEENQVKEKRPTASSMLKEQVDECWRYYLEIIPSRRRLDVKRRRFIEQALKLVGTDGVKRAFLGLSRSPFHNGQNDQRKSYLDVRYALKGIGNESDDERVEKAISWAAIYAPNTTRMDGARVERYLEDMRYTASLPHKPEAQRARIAFKTLRDAGFRIIMLDRAPWVRLER
jgi:hypothetical protein